jgi:hypothetical protein
MVSVYDDASRLVVAVLEGKNDQAQVTQQLLELSSNDAIAVTKVFEEKANVILQQAGAGHFARSQRAGSALTQLAVGLDAAAKKVTKDRKSGELPRRPEVAKAVLDAVIEMTGGPARGPKEKAQRAQAASFIADLVVHVSDHVVAKATLLELSEDKVASIREKALRGLSHMEPDDDVQKHFMVCSTDNDKTVRAAAVASMNPKCGKGVLAALLSRLDDTEATVRAALFNTLAREPDTVFEFGPGILARLVVGLHDRSHVVVEAAVNAVPMWVEKVGGPVELLSKCDLFSDEFLGEDCANQLSRHCRAKSAEQACQWLASGGTCFPGKEREAIMLTRFSVGLMSDDKRDTAVNIPAVLQMVTEALKTASPKDDFFLRQLLHIVAILDFCDEASRRQLAQLTVDVLSSGPVSDISAIPESGNRMKATVHTTVDLGILLLRKCFGFDRSQVRRQKEENFISERVMAVIGDIVKVKIDTATQESQEDEPHFTALSRKLEEISTVIADFDVRKVAASDAKSSAIQTEDFEEAHRQKEVLTEVETHLKPLKVQHADIMGQRDGICHRILAIVSALLKWTHSDIRKDGVLLGMLTGVVRPILKMKALSEEVNLRALHSIGLFCSIDVELAQNHWDFFTRLVANLRELSGADAKAKRTNLRRAMLAAATLSDCARLHGMNGFFDRDQCLSAAGVLAVVPHESREVAIYPLCGWFMSFGALYFEEHMTNPQPEITWALGWMLTEAFSNKAREAEADTEGRNDTTEDDGPSESVLKSQATDLMVFFNILAKHPGKHGEALLCLAVESIIESGLWRCAVSLPVDAHNQQFTRGFSWPNMFEFVQSRLTHALQLRLWRVCLQVCVTSPALAPWAQIPLALAAGIENAPVGAAELVKTAITLGADADALSPIAAGLPPLDSIAVPEQTDLLSPRAEAIKSEEALVAELTELGVLIADWTPPINMKVPKGKPIAAVDGTLKAVAMRSAAKIRRTGTGTFRGDKAINYTAPAPDAAAQVVPAKSPIATPARAPSPKDIAQAAPMEVEAEAKLRGSKRLYSKTKAA